MFGVIVAGRLVQSAYRQVTETQFLFDIPEPENINHVVVFMTGVSPFPENMGGAVYFCWSGGGWSLLGFLTNEKPSAIFKISGLKVGTSDGPFGMQTSPMAQIGISVETLESLSQQTPAVNTNANTADTFMAFSTKMLENLVNYVSSFAVAQSQMVPQPSELFVPLGTLQNWYNNFQRKLQLDPFFWRS